MDDLAVVLARPVKAAKFEARTVRQQGGVDPPVGPPFLEHVGDRRKIDQPQPAFIVINGPPMRVAKEPNLDVPARAQDFQ
jgi:hypothetical protein